MHAKYNTAEEYCPILPEQQPLTYSAEGSVKLHPRAEEGQRPYAWSRLRMHACPILSEQQPMLMSSRSAPQYIVHPADCPEEPPHLQALTAASTCHDSKREHTRAGELHERPQKAYHCWRLSQRRSGIAATLQPVVQINMSSLCMIYAAVT